MRKGNLVALLLACARHSISAPADACAAMREELRDWSDRIQYLERQLADAKLAAAASTLRLRDCGSSTVGDETSGESAAPFLERRVKLPSTTIPSAPTHRRSAGGTKEAPASPPALSCRSQAWRTNNARVRCGAIGGKVDVIGVADAGSWSHAYQEVAVVPGVKYEVSVEFYAEQKRLCDPGAIVLWCTPSLVICPGPYQNRFHSAIGPNGTCYAGLAPYRNDTWEVLSAIFEPSVAVVTVYIAQVERARTHSWQHDMPHHSTPCCNTQCTML
jgi:hypothetical protein